MLFTILGFLGSVLIIIYYLCDACEGVEEVVEVCHGPLPQEEETEKEFEGELEKELNSIEEEEKEKLLATIRRRLKPKVASSSSETDSNPS